MKALRHILFSDRSFPIRYAVWSIYVALPLMVIGKLINSIDLTCYSFLFAVLSYTFIIPIYYIGYYQKKFLWAQSLLGFIIIFLFLGIAFDKLAPISEISHFQAGEMILAFTILYYPIFLIITVVLRWISGKMAFEKNENEI